MDTTFAGLDFTASDFKAAVDATDAQMGDLETYRHLLSEWNERMNLVGPSALQSFWRRHAWDSAQLRALAPDARVWADIGAGAGFPGIILAVLLKNVVGAKVHLVESMTKRCRFLTEVVDRLELGAVVHNARAEQTTISGVEVVTARACAPMERLLHFASPFLKRGAFGLFLKGQGVEAEIVEARKSWAFTSSITPSLSDRSGHIVKIEGLSRA